MYEPFANYVWNLAVNIALSCGGQIGEVDEACAPMIDAERRGEVPTTEEFFARWCNLADRLIALADKDAGEGHQLSAADKYMRASVYLQAAERMQRFDYEPRCAAYERLLASFQRAIELANEPVTRVEVPLGDAGSMPCLFVPAATTDTGGPAPCIVFFNGLDSTKEMVYCSGTADALRRRGVATLIVDHPGTGEALRTRGMKGDWRSELWATAAVDWLGTQPGVDPDRIGVAGWSLGGYYAPRAAAFENRFKLCVAWGANFNWGELQRRRLANQGDRPVPHYWDHVMWVFGQDSVDEFMQFAEHISLVDVMERITCPVLVTHGSNDRQVPVEYAQLQYDAATGASKRELKLFTDEIGGVEHCSADNMLNALAFIADWIADEI